MFPKIKLPKTNVPENSVPQNLVPKIQFPKIQFPKIRFPIIRFQLEPEMDQSKLATGKLLNRPRVLSAKVIRGSSAVR